MELFESIRGRCDYVDCGLKAVKLVEDSLEKWRGSAVGKDSFYSLILLDYSMPNISGPETAKRIN